MAFIEMHIYVGHKKNKFYKPKKLFIAQFLLINYYYYQKPKIYIFLIQKDAYQCFSKKIYKYFNSVSIGAIFVFIKKIYT
jgi:hypothetical protein